MRLFLLLFLPALALGADLSADEWQRVQSEAGALARKPGEGARKIALIETLAAEDSARTAKSLLRVAADAHERREKYARQLMKAEDEYGKVHRRLRKKHGRKASRSVFEKDTKWRACRDAVARHTGELETEQSVLLTVQAALEKIRSPEAIAVLVEGAHPAPEVRRGILEALWHQPADTATDPLLAFAADAKMPLIRSRILHWIGKHKVTKGFDTAVVALRARESAVARSALAALESLDDPRCVPHLVEARAKASGLFAAELDSALTNFTGETFHGIGAEASWTGWWSSKGEAWLRSAGAKRFAPEKPAAKANAQFYGVETPSDRIVFVLDRSGSMNNPVPQHGPVTGKNDHVPGKTRLEVAQNQLARTIRSLPTTVKFAVVFYSHEINTWKEPPALIPATASNKKVVIDWVMALTPVGSTRIFDALDEALRYAKVGGGKSATDPKGADTIFLLSDGAPTAGMTEQLLKGEALEQEFAEFLDANRALRCVVHTIGVGPQHNRRLMQRLASETGGTYKAVAVK